MENSLHRDVPGLPGARLRRVTDYIDANLPRPIPLAELSSLAHLSRFHFARLFKVSTGMSPHRFIVQRRIDRACALLRNASLPIKTVAGAVGFRTTNHFSTMFRRVIGCPPGVYRRHGVRDNRPEESAAQKEDAG
jgi:AraC family transcriptional regulator